VRDLLASLISQVSVPSPFTRAMHLPVTSACRHPQRCSGYIHIRAQYISRVRRRRQWEAAGVEWNAECGVNISSFDRMVKTEFITPHRQYSELQQNVTQICKVD